MAAWTDRWWEAADGTRLHARDYPGPADRPPVVCLPGLTRNARDFHDLALSLGAAARVLAVDLRGRGESGWARDAMSYLPPVYLADVGAMLDALGIARAVLVGTSLGGILAMMAAAAWPGRVAGALLNDVGPVLEPAGLERIRGYVGRATSCPTWLHAARAIREVHGAAFPGYGLRDWIAMAKRLCRVNGAGRIVNDYDVRIAEPFRLPPPAAPVDLWPALRALQGTPVLIVRGASSDILSAATADRMAAELPDAERLELPGIGHAPTLGEPGCAAAIARLLARAAAAG